jgi:cellulose synthase/poly-beta-1,6-N-acetylglucosamine synthase-like glycosyltransferase
MLLTVFILCVLTVAYPIIVYPLLLWLVVAVRPRPWLSGRVTDKVAFIITVFNEEQRIEAKLRNTLNVVGHDRKAEIIVASDGSTDGTEEVVRRFASCGVRWLDCPRRGKEAAQIDAIQATDADILVFSDASTEIDPTGLDELLRPFADPSIGAVSGCDKVRTPNLTGEYAYIAYDNAVRNAESLCHSIMGLSGCFFAVRRRVAEGFLPGVPSDFGAALICVRQGLRAVIQPTACCFYAPTSGGGSLYRRWHRTILRGMRCLFAYRDAISWRRPLASWQVLSHKGLRFLTPFFAVLALATAGCAAANGQTWAIIVWAVFVPLSIVGLLSSALDVSSNYLRVFRPIGFSLIATLAAAAAWCSLAAGRTDATWAPTKRSSYSNPKAS